MRQLQPIDRLLLCTLFPIWCVVFTLHVREIQRVGVLQVPVFASPGRGQDYPSVGGFRFERDSEGTGLRVGDRLLSVGGVDLRGAGYFGFDAITFDAAGASRALPLVFEREGERHEITLVLRPSKTPWSRLPFSLSFAAIALVVLFRAPRARATRFFFAGYMGFAIFETPFEGGSRIQTYAAYSVFYLVGPVTVLCLLRWLTLFPDEMPERNRASPAWVSVGVLFILSRLNYVFGGPVPPGFAAQVVIATDAIIFTTALGIMTRNYWMADPIGRRRIKWVLYGTYLSFLPVFFSLLDPLVDIRFAEFEQLLNVGLVMSACLPLGILIAILRYRLFDIDRLISTTATLSVLAGVAITAAVTLIPPLARALAAAVGIEPGSGQVTLSALLAVACVPAHRALRPQIDQLLFAERHAVERGIAALLPTLADCVDARTLTQRVGAEVHRLLRPDVSVIYADVEGSFAPVFAEGRAVPPSFEASGPLIGTLRERRTPLALDHAPRRRGEAERGAFERAALETLGAEVIVPVRRGAALLAFMCLGAKRSRDVYTETDLSLLTAVAEKLSNELLRFDQDEVIRSGRALQEALRRYVPGAVAEELAGGSEITSAEREVSVLFVDIRGYTSLSEGRRPEEIFSTVNRYTETVSEVVRRHGGAVVEFNGDGMMAVFGAPRPLARKERAAVEAGVEIASAVESIRVEDASGVTRQLSVGVGIATGPAFVGNIQAVDRLIWTAIGNTTNLAARLQALTRELDAAIVIDLATREAAGEVADGFARCQGVAIRGRRQAMELYALPLRVSDHATS